MRSPVRSFAPVSALQKSIVLGCLLCAWVSSAVAGDVDRTTSITSAAVETLIVPGYPDFLAADGDAVWVTNAARVEKLQRGEAHPVLSVAMPGPCGGMTVAFNALWVADCKEAAIYRINRFSGDVIAVVRTGLADPKGELSLASGAGSVWVLSDAAGVLSRIDPRTNNVSARIAVRPASYAAAFGFGSVWVSNTGMAGGGNGSIQRVDPATNRVTATIEVGQAPRFLVAGEGATWSLNQGDGSVTRIDPRINAAVATIDADAPGSGSDIDAGGGRVWVRSTRTLLSAIDPKANRIAVRYGPPAGSGAVRVAQDGVWVTAHDTSTVWVLPLVHSPAGN